MTIDRNQPSNKKNPTGHLGRRDEIAAGYRDETPVTAWCGFAAIPRPFDLTQPITVCRTCVRIADKVDKDREVVA